MWQQTKKAYLRELNSKTDRVVVGRVGRPHGLDGFAVLHPDTDYPGRFVPGARFLTGDGHELVIRAVRHQGRDLQAAFAGFADRTAVESLRNSVLTIGDRERRALGAGEFWPDQLEGLEVRSAAGERLGTVVMVLLPGGQDRLVVRTVAGREVEVPFASALVGDIDVERGYLVVAPPEGLFGDF